MTDSTEGRLSPPVLQGNATDDLGDVLAIGRCPVTSIFVSMSGRHPEGRDAEYLGWHTFDHRPEQYRLSSLRGSLRLVSTPDCRAARVVSDARFDAVDHVMSYLFADLRDLKGFNDLAIALGGGGRIPYLLPLVERGIYELGGMAAAPRIKVGADVMPWWPIQGAFLLLEQGSDSRVSDLVAVPGVAGAWSAAGVAVDQQFPTADDRPMSWSEGLQITYCFLDDDPVATAPRLEKTLENRWSDSEVVPLLAAPFYPVTGYDYDRHLP